MSKVTITNNDLKLLKEKYPDNLDEIIEKINNYYPIQYLIGNVNFYGYQIEVNENALIPRFETESLLEKTINYIKQLNISNPNILDIGTGTGCIDIVLKKEIKCNVTSLDINDEAIKLAKLNAKNNNVEINFLHKDILKENIDNKYDVIISNPPYLTHNDDVSPSIIFEPQNALYAENNGLIFYEEIIKKSLNHVNDKFLIAFEIGDTQGTEVVEIAKKYYRDAIILCEQDLTNRDRYVFIMNK